MVNENKRMALKTHKGFIKTIPRERGSCNAHCWIVLICDLDDFALYLNKSGGYFSGYEVHRIRVRKARRCTIKGHSFTVPVRRIIAGDDEFGRYAWAYPTLKMVFHHHPQFLQHVPMIVEKTLLERSQIGGVLKKGAVE